MRKRACIGACAVALAAVSPGALASGWQARWTAVEEVTPDTGSDPLTASMFHTIGLPLRGWTAVRVTIKSEKTVQEGVGGDPYGPSVFSTALADKVDGSVRIYCPIPGRTPGPDTPRPFTWASAIYLNGDSVRRLPRPRGYTGGNPRCTLHVAAWATAYGLADGEAEPYEVRLALRVQAIR